MKVSEKSTDVVNRLSLLGLSVNQAKEIGLRAITAKYNVVRNHPRNAGGLMAYMEGVKTLRDELGKNSDWEVKARIDNIETIKNAKRKIEVAYSNVDYACLIDHNPQPISKKGKASKNAINSNQLSLFGNDLVTNSNRNYQLWYVLVSEDNGKINVEISLPTSMENGYFTEFQERIFCVKDATPDDIEDLYNISDDEVEYDDEIILTKK